MSPMEMTAQEIAQLADGQLVGDAAVTIEDGQPLHLAQQNHVTFLTKPSLFRELRKANPGVCLVPESLQDQLPDDASCTWVIAKNVDDAFLNVLLKLRPTKAQPEMGVSDQATVDASATIGEQSNVFPGAHIAEGVTIGQRCNIYPGVYIGPNAQLADDVDLYPNVVIYHDVVLGNRVKIQGGTVIGGAGFGYRTKDGRHEHIPHLGTVIIEDDVEIGANSTIDRGAIAATVIRKGTKMDNLVMIAHNCDIGEHNLFTSQVCIAGSVTTGSYVFCGGQVGIRDHVTVGDMVKIGGKSGVHRDLPGHQSYLGHVADIAEDTTRQVIALKRLPDMRKSLRALERTVDSLQAQLAALTNNGAEEKKPAA